MVGERPAALAKEVPGIMDAIEDIKREGQSLGAVKFAMWLRQRGFDVLTADESDIIEWSKLIPDYHPY